MKHPTQQSRPATPGASLPPGSSFPTSAWTPTRLPGSSTAWLARCGACPAWQGTSETTSSGPPWGSSSTSSRPRPGGLPRSRPTSSASPGAQPPSAQPSWTWRPCEGSSSPPRQPRPAPSFGLGNMLTRLGTLHGPPVRAWGWPREGAGAPPAAGRGRLSVASSAHLRPSGGPAADSTQKVSLHRCRRVRNRALGRT